MSRVDLFTIQKGFSLAELLISLLIIAQIATFTIPKVLTARQNQSYNAIAKEAMAAVSEAYHLYRAENTPTSGTKSRDLIPYLNYLKYDTSSTVDSRQGSGTRTCTSAAPCLFLHNGAAVYFWNLSFNGTTNLNTIAVTIDPDGSDSTTTTNSPGKGLEVFIYFNGRLTTRATVQENTSNSGFPDIDPVATYDPPWFSWD